MARSHHPAAEAFPMMDDDRFNELRADIDTNRLLVPITLYGGQILDGRNRQRACDELDIEPDYETYDGDPWAYVWSLNGQRRDLVDEQRYLIWKHCNERGEAWQAEQDRIREEANRKKSKAATGNKNASKDKPKTVREHNAPALSEHPDRQAKANAAKVNSGAVARGDKLAKDRPDLAEKVSPGPYLEMYARETSEGWSSYGNQIQQRLSGI